MSAMYSVQNQFMHISFSFVCLFVCLFFFFVSFLLLLLCCCFCLLFNEKKSRMSLIFF